VLLQPLNYNDPDRLYIARELRPQQFGQMRLGVNPNHPPAWAKDCPSIEQTTVFRGGTTQLNGGSGDPVTVPSVGIQHGFFQIFGVEPMLGRTFLPEEEQEGGDGAPVAILSESLWRSRFGADPSIVGRQVLMDGRNHMVVGVAPRGLRLPFGNGQVDVFLPLVLSAQDRSRLMGNHNFAGIVRLRHGVTPEQATAEINVVQARFPILSGAVQKDLGAVLIPVHEQVTGRAKPGLWMLTAAVGGVLLIVCINLANLLLSRVAARRREAAIRTALGAGRGRQFSQILTESMVLAITGGVIGLLVARWIVDFVVGSTSTVGLPRLHEVRLDPTVLAFGFGLTLVTAILFGALPAWRFTRNDPQEALRGGGSSNATENRRGLRLREGLIGLEVCLSAALLITAGLLGTSLTRLMQVDKGFDVQHILTVPVRFTSVVYADDTERQRFLDRVLSATRAIPAVEASAITTQLPSLGETWQDPIYLDPSREARRFTVNNRYTSPEYFRAMNIKIKLGRGFEDADRSRKQHVGVLSEKAAKLLWPEEANPVGRTFYGEDDKVTLLIGVAAEVRATLQNEPPPTAYYPHWQRTPDVVALLVRTANGDPKAVAGAIRSVLRNEDPQLPIPAIQTMEELVDRSVAERRFQLVVMLVFAVASLLVASLGIYGVVSYSVACRRTEIGIRVALGAQRSRLLGLVFRQGMTPVAIGLASGVLMSLFLGRAIRGLLFGVQPSDPYTIARVAVTLLAVGALACLIPARRAASADAVKSLRFE
jgi:predicted permease